MKRDKLIKRFILNLYDFCIMTINELFRTFTDYQKFRCKKCKDL